MNSNESIRKVQKTVARWQPHWILSNEITDSAVKSECSLEFVQRKFRWICTGGTTGCYFAEILHFSSLRGTTVLYIAAFSENSDMEAA
ncbi:hypothetical protein PAENIP36_18290 [Paenibacillus sp. P36]